LKDSDTIHVRIAQILRALEYAALIVILFSLALKFINYDKAIIGAKAGIGLIIFAPVTGIIAIGVIAFLSKSYRYFMTSLLILLILLIAVGVNL
jgi:hypothetical protein